MVGAALENGAIDAMGPLPLGHLVDIKEKNFREKATVTEEAAIDGAIGVKRGAIQTDRAIMLLGRMGRLRMRVRVGKVNIRERRKEVGVVVDDRP